MDASVLYSQSRSRDVVNARNIAMYLIRRMTNLSLVDIGQQFEGRNHTTVMSSVNKIEDMLKNSPDMAATIRDITSNINSKN